MSQSSERKPLPETFNNLIQAEIRNFKRPTRASDFYYILAFIDEIQIPDKEIPKILKMLCELYESFSDKNEKHARDLGSTIRRMYDYQMEALAHDRLRKDECFTPPYLDSLPQAYKRPYWL